ncbi:hypothetical protein F5888DRAFT_532979 [Russula emetica]|nr:hypothetical protein F5888DRAFT_532979 [Russula emetica]
MPMSNHYKSDHPVHCYKTLPSASLSLAPSAAATSAVSTESTKQLAWQPAVYLVVVLVFVAIVAGVIWLIWNDPCIPSTTRRGKMESIETDSTFHFPSASALVRRMLGYLYTMLWPAFRHIRQTTTTSLGGVGGGTGSRPQHALPLFVPPEFREPHVATPRPIMPRDTSSFRVQSNPYSCSEPSSWPVASPYSVTVLPAGSAP